MIAKHLGDYAFFLARIFFVVLGCGAVAWGAVEFPIFWQEFLPDRIANRILAGEQFKFEPLRQAAFSCRAHR